MRMSMKINGLRPAKLFAQRQAVRRRYGSGGLTSLAPRPAGSHEADRCFKPRSIRPSLREASASKPCSATVHLKRRTKLSLYADRQGVWVQPGTAKLGT